MRTLFTLAALVGLLLTGPAVAARRAPKKELPPAPRLIGPVVVVSGHAADADAAREQALKNAQEKVAELLAEKLGAASARVFAVEDLKRLGAVQAISAAEPSPVRALPDQPLLEVHCQVALTAELVRAAQAGSRQGTLLRVIAALMVVFALVCGYLRLEEWTRGYATRLLRLLVSLVLIVTGIILWLTW